MGTSSILGTDTRVGSARAGIPRASTGVDAIDGLRVCPGPHPICRFERPFAERRIVWAVALTEMMPGSPIGGPGIVRGGVVLRVPR